MKIKVSKRFKIGILCLSISISVFTIWNIFTRNKITPPIIFQETLAIIVMIFAIVGLLLVMLPSIQSE